MNLDDVPGAIAEIRRSRREANAAAVVILGTAGDRKLDDLALDPFYAACCVIDSPLAVHVGWSSPSLSRIAVQAFLGRTDVPETSRPLFLAENAKRLYGW